MIGVVDRDVDKVHDLMDEVAEQQEIANEIGEAISNPVGFGQDVDEVSTVAYMQSSEKFLYSETCEQ
jgi:charged multivesicular body protein 4